MFAPLSVTQDIPQYQFDLQQILIDSFPNATGEKLRERDTPSQISFIVLKTHLPFSLRHNTLSLLYFQEQSIIASQNSNHIPM